jgi:large subunit ribosomal protein L6
MSRIGKQVITIPSGVEATVNGSTVSMKSSKGSLTHVLPEGLSAVREGTTLTVKIANEEDRFQRMLWGTHASILANMVEGLVNGYSKKLEINGVGYKVAAAGQKLTFQIGFSHPVVYEVHKNIKIEIEKNVITVSGVDKQLVGLTASQIRSLRPPEPYKGKGIKYSDETIRRKAGKAATSAAA